MRKASDDEQSQGLQSRVTEGGYHYSYESAGHAGYPSPFVLDCDFGSSSSSSSASIGQAEGELATPKVRPASSPPAERASLEYRPARFFEGVLSLRRVGAEITCSGWKLRPHPKTSDPPGASEHFNLDFSTSGDEYEDVGPVVKAHRTARRERRDNKRYNFRALRSLAIKEGRRFVQAHSSSHIICGFRRADYELLGREFACGVASEIHRLKGEARQVLQLPPLSPEPLRRRKDLTTLESSKAGRRCGDNRCDPDEGGSPRLRNA